MNMLRTIRLDPSDTFVFPQAAEPGEWAVTGSFLFWNRDVAALTGKERAAFRSGFAGVDSLGSNSQGFVSIERHDASRSRKIIARLIQRGPAHPKQVP